SRRESGGMSKEQYPNSLGLRNVSGKTRSSQTPQGNLMRGTFRSIMIVSALAILGTSARAQTPVQMSPARSAPPLNRADLEAWLDGLVPYALQQGDIAGLVVSVVKDGQLLLEKGYGYADVTTKTLMDPERTVLRVASVSKSFTSTAVMQLVERGKLAL